MEVDFINGMAMCVVSADPALVFQSTLRQIQGGLCYIYLYFGFRFGDRE